MQKVSHCCHRVLFTCTLSCHGVCSFYHGLCDSNKPLYTGMDTGPVDPQVGSGLVAYKRCAKSMGKPKI